MDAGPPDAGPVLVTRTIRISSDDADATWYDPAGNGGPPTDEIVFNPMYPDVEVGTDGASGRAAFRFLADIPRGSTVVSAKLEARTVRGLWSGTEQIKVQTFSQLDLPPFDEAHSHLPEQHGDAGLGPTPALTGWPLDAGLNAWLMSPELRILVQPLVTRPDWAQGKTLSFLLTPDAPGIWYVDFSDFGANLGYEARLHLSWLEPGPIGIWRFEETGALALDTSGSNTHGNLVGPTRTDGGRVGRDLQFDGVDDSVNLGNTIALVSSFTGCAFIYPTGLPPASDDAVIVSKRGAGQDGWQLDTTVDVGPRAIGFKPGDFFRYGATTLGMNQWYHVCGVYDGFAREVHVYLNGVNDDGVQVGTVTAFIVNNAENLLIGQRPGSTGYEFNGRIDEVMIWNRALSAAQVNQVYRSFP